VNNKQRRAVEVQVRKGCQKCGAPATILIVWSFEDMASPSLEHPIQAFIRCDAHVGEVRAEKPQSPPHIYVRVYEEPIKPLVLQ
jgi:hypothetical protein